MKNETVKDIRDSLRYWQANKDAESHAFVSITVTDDPKDTERGTHILIKEVVFKIPMPEGQGSRTFSGS